MIVDVIYKVLPAHCPRSNFFSTVFGGNEYTSHAQSNKVKVKLMGVFRANLKAVDKRESRCVNSAALPLYIANHSLVVP